jgi:hypothetical protein
MISTPGIPSGTAKSRTSRTCLELFRSRTLKPSLSAIAPSSISMRIPWLSMKESSEASTLNGCPSRSSFSSRERATSTFEMSSSPMSRRVPAPRKVRSRATPWSDYERLLLSVPLPKRPPKGGWSHRKNGGVPVSSEVGVTRADVPRRGRMLASEETPGRVRCRGLPTGRTTYADRR